MKTPMRYFARLLLLALVVAGCFVDAPPDVPLWQTPEDGPTATELHHLYPDAANLAAIAPVTRWSVPGELHNPRRMLNEAW